MIRLIIALVALCSCAASYRTANFVVSAPTPQLAQQVGDEGERCRRGLAMQWLGYELPRWAQPCPVTVQVGDQLGAGGATSFNFDKGEVFGWEMRLQGSAERILDSVLPHEILHTIFASHFRQPLPRWADEGGATTPEHPTERARQWEVLEEVLRADRGINFETMFRMMEYPPDTRPLYAQGYSLCEFLLHHADRLAFVAFLTDGVQSGDWPAAVTKHYRYESLSALQQSWLSWFMDGRPEPTVVTLKPYWDPIRRCWTPDKAKPSAPPPNPEPSAKLAPLVQVQPAVEPGPAAEDKPTPSVARIEVTEEQLINGAGKVAADLLKPQLDRIEQRLGDQCKAAPAVSHGTDDAGSGGADGQPGRAGTEAATNTNTASRHSGSISAGWLSWLGAVGGRFGTTALAGLGISAPVAAIAVWLGRRTFKRAVRRAVAQATAHADGGNVVERIIERPVDREIERIIEKTRPIVHNRKETENRFVRVEETDAAGEAFKKAIAEEVQLAPPAVVAALQRVQQGAKMHLDGHSARKRMDMGWND